MHLVSAIIPMYNAESTIERAIFSIKNQTYPNIEIIVIDDCSTDNSRTIVQKAPEVTLVEMVANRGAATARNLGISRARGDYIAFLDADDIWLPEKIELQVKLIQGSPLNPAIVSCNARGIYSDGVVKTPDYYKEYAPVRGNTIWKDLLVRDFIFTPTVLVKRTIFNSVGVFNERLTICEDWDLWIRITRKYAFDYCPQILTHIYENRTGSLMDSHRENLAWIPLTIENILYKYGNDPEYPIPLKRKKAIFGAAYLQYGYCYFMEGRRKEAQGYFLKAFKMGHRRFKTLSLLLRNYL